VIGIYGLVEDVEGTDVGKNNIRSLTFLINTCPIRSMYDFELHHHVSQTFYEELSIDAADPGIFVWIIFGICVSLCLCLCCYSFIKNRGMILKKKEVAGGAAAPVSNDSEMQHTGILPDLGIS